VVTQADPSALPAGVSRGNAAVDGAPFNGWFVGDFTRWLAERSTSPSALASVGLRDTPVLEVKWGIHPAGQPRPAGWATRTPAVGVSVLVAGEFVVVFREDARAPEREVRLCEQGDYVVWGPAVEHRWYAVRDSIILTVRWATAHGASIATSDAPPESE
jgi:hypothetical protein